MTFTSDLNPFDRAAQWIDDSRNAGDKYPDAACLSTVRPDGYPDGRMVLVRRVSDDGFVFFTNSQSVKGRSLAEAPKASLTFYWVSMGRQLRVTGDVEWVSEADSDAYFNGRFLISQLGAWASDQSQPLVSREVLLAKVDAVSQQYEGKSVPRPPHWIGYRIRPIRIEFWVEGEYRLHDRFEYRRSSDGWEFSRLNP